MPPPPVPGTAQPTPHLVHKVQRKVAQHPSKPREERSEVVGHIRGVLPSLARVVLGVRPHPGIRPILPRSCGGPGRCVHVDVSREICDEGQAADGALVDVAHAANVRVGEKRRGGERRDARLL